MERLPLEGANAIASAGPTIVGGPGNDVLTGTAGQDVFQGLAGNDTLIGADGIDLALYPGAKAGYRVSAPRLGTWVVEDIDPSDGDEGSDTLVDVEKLRFVDGDLQLGAVGEFLVNTWVHEHQEKPAIARLAAGGWVAVWASYGQDGDGFGVYAQRYGADGRRAGAEFRLNLSTQDDQHGAAIAALAGGGFVAVWSSGRPGESWQLIGRRFAEDGTPLGDEFAIDGSFTGSQGPAATTARPDGGFTVVWGWSQAGVQHLAARSFGSDGAALGPAYQVDGAQPPESIWQAASAAPLPGGGIAALWSSDPLDGLGSRAVARLFGADGVALGPEWAVGSREQGAQWAPQVAAVASGGMVVTWHCAGVSGTGAGRGIYAQQLDATGHAIGSVVQVNALTDDPYDPYGNPAVAGLTDGGFVITWLGTGTDGVDVLARRYAPNGTATGAQFLVNTVTDGQQWTPTISGLADGGFVIAWRSDGLDSPRYDSWGTGGIFAQRYNARGEPVVAADPSGSVGTAIDDFLVGGPTADTLVGLAGDDTLAGLGGDDTLDGGPGADRALYQGPMGDYLFSNTQTYWFDLTDTQAGNGDEGRDRLTGIEQVVFTDGTLQVAQRSEFLLTDGSAVSSSPGAIEPALARLTDGRFVAAWTGADASRGGVFAQVLAPDAMPAAAAFRVNTTFWLDQSTPSVSALPDGGFLIVWESEPSGIHGQRHAASGVAVGNEFRINSDTQFGKHLPVVAVQPSGEFLVVWHSYGQDGSGHGIYGQRFSATATPLGGEFRVNEGTLGEQAIPAIAAIGDGSYLIAWQSMPLVWPQVSDVHARRYAGDGTALTAEFRVNPMSPLLQGNPALAALADGGWLVVWHAQPESGYEFGIYGQRYAASGAAVGAAFQVNTTTGQTTWFPEVAVLSDGGFVVVWISGQPEGPGAAAQYDVYGQRFDATGARVGGEFRISTLSPAGDLRATVTAAADGGFLVAWPSVGDDATSEVVLGKRFLASGEEFNELRITGTDGSDTLRAGEGLQVLIGGDGDDVYEADLVRDRIVEVAGGGHDTLHSWVTATLPGPIEDLLLLGDAHIDGVGNEFGNRLDGNAGDNRLAGLSGDDLLVGGAGNDTLIGGAGNDTLTGGIGHDVFEFAASGNGLDLMADFGDGDRILVRGANLLAPAAPGDGAALPAGQVQFHPVGEFTMLYVGTDAALGADIVIRLAGVFSAVDLHPEGEAIRFNNAPSVALPLADAVTTEDLTWTVQLPAGAFVDTDAWLGDRLACTARLSDGRPLPAWLSFDPAARTFSGTPGDPDVGDWSIEVTATDAALATVSDRFVLTVLGINDPPELVSPLPDVVVVAGLGLQVTLTSREIRDVDPGDRLVHAFELESGASLPGWLSFDAASRTLLGTPAAADVGALSIRLTTTDMALAGVEDVFTLTVEPWALAAPQGDARRAYALVHALTGEAAPAAMLGRWLAGFDAGNSAEQVAAQLLAEASPGIGDDALIGRLYAHILGRAPTEEERAALLAMLDSGAMTRAGLLATAAALPECLARIAPEIVGGIQWTPWLGTVLAFDADAAAGRAYAMHHALNGEPPAPAALGRWMATFAHDDENEVARQMLAADAPSVGNAALVARMFENVVGRPPLPDEQARFQALLDSGELTQPQLLVLAARTTENQALIGGSIAEGMALQRWDDAVLTQDLAGPPGVVYALLFALLDAAPAPAVIGRWIASADALAASGGMAGAGLLDPSARLALADAMLAVYEPVISNAQLVALLFEHLTERAPTVDEQGYFQGLLDGGDYSQAGLLQYAAELDINLAQYVELVGQGIEYLPWPGT